MFSIKKSFADCLRCPLLDAPSCILETNSEDDLSKVEVVFVAENPGIQEVKQERPLVGQAGKMFRRYFEMFNINKLKYLLTNCVLCQTLNPDGTTGNPTDDVIELCKVNCIEIIKICKPKLLVVMGTSPMSALGIAKSGITNLHGRVTEWNNFKTMVIVHPSFVNRNRTTWEPKFKDAMAKIATLLGKQTKIQLDHQVQIQGKGIYRYKIPDKFYTDNYRLVDIQYIRKQQKVLYIFRDKNNKKVYHTEDNNYVCYQVPKGVPSKKILPFDQLNQVHIKYRDQVNLDPSITYEGDIKLPVKHAIDYYFYNKGEAKKNYQNILFLDIEVNTGSHKGFPYAKDANYPICIVTTLYNGTKITYTLERKELENRNNLLIFKNEKSLLIQLIKDIRTTDPDFIAGWNLMFDLEYIYNRLPKVGLSQENISPFNEVYIEASKYICSIAGIVPLDQLYLYRNFTFTQMENYKLGFIGQHELGITKIELEESFSEIYQKDPNKAIEYNIRDVDLIAQLEDKLSHILLIDELRAVCNTTFDSISSLGQIDSLIVSYLRNKNLASKNADPHIIKEHFSGAFVLEPEPGIYSWIADFDFASLYPSLMITYNIGVNTLVMKTKQPSLGYKLAYSPNELPEKIPVIIDPVNTATEVIVTKEDLLKKIEDSQLIHTINGCFFLSHDKEFSVFAEIVDMLMSQRKEYKSKMFEAIENKDKENEKYYYTRQLVYKVLANTLYGVTANKAFRFFDTSISAAITLSGQEALKTSIVEANRLMTKLCTSKEQSLYTLTENEIFGDKLNNRFDFIVTGDTDSIFCCFQDFKNVNVSNVQKWCKQVESYLNDDKILEVVKRHNASLDYNRLKLKNELVISRGLFLAKKRYAIHVINNEGKDVDKINFMGLEVKRSDFPSKTKEFLTELTELILKSDKFSITNIFQFIERKEKEFVSLIRQGDKSLARPVTFGKELKQYKTIPQAVRAMVAWNELMYEIHVPGSRAYMFWIKGIDFDKVPSELQTKVRMKHDELKKKWKKIDVIAIPDEEPRLPDFFVPDVQKCLKFVFKDRYNLLLEPIIKVSQQKELLTI